MSTTEITITTTKAAADYLQAEWELPRPTRTKVTVENPTALYRLIDALEQTDSPNRSTQKVVGRAINALKDAFAAAGGLDAVNAAQAERLAAEPVDACEIVAATDPEMTADKVMAAKVIEAARAPRTGGRPARPVALQAFNEDGTKAGRVVTFGAWAPAAEWAQELVDNCKADRVVVTNKFDGQELVVG